MGVQHLDGKRTGRPRGARTTSRVRRDMRWAYDHLGKEDARPPSPGAKMWADMARMDPELFLACVTNLEAAGEVRAPSKGERGGQAANKEPEGDAPTGWVGKKPGRFKTLFLSWAHIEMNVSGDRRQWVTNIPQDAQLIGGAFVPSRRGFEVTIRSETFPVVPAGEPIPELTLEYINPNLR